MGCQRGRRVARLAVAVSGTPTAGGGRWRTHTTFLSARYSDERGTSSANFPYLALENSAILNAMWSNCA